MRMPKYAKIQNRRAREDSSASTSASKVWAFLNSAFVLWVLSAVALTAGGNIFSERQKCLADARELFGRFNHLDEELSARDDFLAKSIRQSKTPIDLDKRPLPNEVRHHDLANVPGNLLVDEVDKIYARADQKEMARLRAQLPVKDPFQHAGNLLSRVYIGQMKLPEAVAELDKHPYRNNVIVLSSDCSWSKVAYRLIDGDDHILWPSLPNK